MISEMFMIVTVHEITLHYFPDARMQILYFFNFVKQIALRSLSLNFTLFCEVCLDIPTD